MKIGVLIKQVPGGDSPLRVSSDHSWIDETSVNFETNESDSYALEEGLQLREKKGEGEVVGREFIRCLSIGASRRGRREGTARYQKATRARDAP